MPEFKYVGPLMKVVAVVDGVERHLTRGDVLNVTSRQAERLGRDTANWEKVATKKATDKKGDE